MGTAYRRSVPSPSGNIRLRTREEKRIGVTRHEIAWYFAQRTTASSFVARRQLVLMDPRMIGIFEAAERHRENPANERVSRTGIPTRSNRIEGKRVPEGNRHICSRLCSNV